MSKVKGLLLLVLGVLLVDFAVENALLSPNIKLFKFDLGKLPTFLLVYGSCGVGLIGGWLGHALKVRRQKRAALLEAKPESRHAPQEQQPQ